MTKDIKHLVENDYFEYKNRLYYAGTKLKIKVYIGTRYEKIVETYFLRCVINDDNKLLFGCEDQNTPFVTVDRSDLENAIIEILHGNYYLEQDVKKKYVNDFNIAELFIGWFLYIFIMVGTSIFNGREIGWIMWSVLFFLWRHNKKEEDGVYYTKK